MPKREWLLRAVIAALPRARSEWTRAVMAEMADVPADQRGSWAAGGVRVAAGETFSPSALHHQGPVVEAVGLSKRYGARVVAVDGLDLRIERGETYGLLGPNGAGKTTTIRMVLGLVRPSSGSVTVLGRPAGSAAAIRSIGAMGDTAFYPFLSGRDNLRALARRAGVDDDRVETVLEQVSLRPRAGDHFSGYSLGMKQRLGVAAALLKDPVLLVLDEPSNGLDPEGQLEMRRLITRLRAGGRTILLSSHDLDEVERLCDRVGIVAGGRMLAEGTPDSLRGDPRLDIQATPLQAARRDLGRGRAGSRGRGRRRASSNHGGREAHRCCRVEHGAGRSGNRRHRAPRHAAIARGDLPRTHRRTYRRRRLDAEADRRVTVPC